MNKPDYDPLTFGTVDFGKTKKDAETDGGPAEAGPEDVLFDGGTASAADTFQASGPQFSEPSSGSKTYDDDDEPAGFDVGAGENHDILSTTAIAPQGALDESSADGGSPSTPATAAESEAESEAESATLPSGASLYESMQGPAAEADAEPVEAPPWVDKPTPRDAQRPQRKESERIDVLQLQRLHPPRIAAVSWGVPLVLFSSGAAGGAWIGLIAHNPILGGVVFAMGSVGAMFCRILLR